VVDARCESQRFVIVPATKPKWEFDDDQDRALLLRLAARGGDRRAGVCGRVSLHGVPTAYWLALLRRHFVPERAGAHRGVEQGLCARQRLGATDRNSFLPGLRLLGVLVRGIVPGLCRHRLWHIRRPVNALADAIRVGGDAASLGDLQSPTRSVYGPAENRRSRPGAAKPGRCERWQRPDCQWQLSRPATVMAESVRRQGATHVPLYQHSYPGDFWPGRGHTVGATAGQWAEQKTM